MNLQNRIDLLKRLREYLLENTEEWKAVKQLAYQKNGWFIQSFVDLSIQNIADYYLDESLLNNWVRHYAIDDNVTPKNVGVVMAGNIPLVGFHDFLSVFISGHRQTIKLAGKDEILLKHLVEKMYSWVPEVKDNISFETMLKGCDAYIATGSNNSAVYFDYYFGKYHSIIRRNRTSVAVLSGTESAEELEKLSADIHTYFGLGCRNVTKLLVPEGYDFVPLLQSFHAYKYFGDHHKYRNNYDYNLSVMIMNNRFYMTNEATLLVENESIFSPISQLNYSFYKDREATELSLRNNPDIQCIAGLDIDFGKTQQPGLTDYADGVDTMQFLLTL